ncbi:SH3 domain-containing protein [Aurantimonas sp. A2-1-M11]|uniref:SH3 domain-containing protein n=1 Tax=Aurantimonas sp. A2-1-M11 TaxID=3113712 RepID=UPI002F942229
MTSENLTGVVAFLGALSVSTTVLAATAIATTDVNLRAGPSTRYPVVNVVGNGDDVRVFGCLDSRSWCDVGYAGQRGWMSSNFLAFVDRGRRYTGPTVVERVGVPTISFSFGSYWDDHYRGRGSYRDRDRYDGRREVRRERREERRDLRDARREVRQDRRDVRDARRDLRDARRDGENTRAERRELRQERRDLRWSRRELRQERRD